MTSGAERGPDIFSDRREAGRLLGEALHGKYAGRDIVVLGLPRGGVPVAHEVALVLGAPLDVLAVRKLGAPFNREFALGAIATGGARVLDIDSMAYLGFEEADLDPIVAREQAELERRERLYRSGRGPLDLREKTVILVDDGIATGSTMAAAVQAARTLGCRAVVAAAPTASREAVAHLERAADAVEILRVPEPYIAVGVWYGAFPQLTDDEVVDLLAKTAPRP